MKFRIAGFTWVYASLSALAVALVAVACDDVDAVAEEDLAVEALDEDVQDRAQPGVEEDAELLADEAEELPDGVEERTWRDDDDDDGGRRHRRHHRRHDDDDDNHRRHDDDDDNHRRHDDDDDNHRRDWDDDDDHNGRW